VVAVALVVIGNHLGLSRIVKTQALKRNDKRYETCRNSTQTLTRSQSVDSDNCSISLRGLALDVQDVPNPRQTNGTWVTDMAGILDEPTEAQLNSVISQLEHQNGTEIAVVTVPETAPAASPKEFTTKLFNYWGIGKKGKDNGRYFDSKRDRRVEIETGYGVEAILPDAKVGNIISTQITPRFKQGDFKGGTLAGTKALVVALEAPQVPCAASEPSQAITSAHRQLGTQPLALTDRLRIQCSWGLLMGRIGIGARLWLMQKVVGFD
jgi:uncharacterized protein